MARCRRAKFWAGVGFALRDTAWNRIAAMREPDTVAVERRRIDNLSARRIPLLQNDGYLCTFLQEAEKEVVGRVPTRGVSSMFFGGLQYVAVKRHNWRIDFMAKMTIPDELKADIPPTAWGKVLTATPIIMTVIATALAGLASSEMTRAQYSRSLAAQQQSKAGDQWGFFQAKRLRGAIQRNSIDILQNTTDVHPLDAAVLDKAGSTLLQSPAGQQAVAALLKGEMPGVPAGPVLEGELQAAVELVEKEGPDARVRLTDKQMAEALDAAKERARLFDATMQPINQVIDTIEKALAGVGDKSLNRDFVAASGLLSGKYKQGAPLPAGSRLARLPQHASDFLNDRNWRIVTALDQFANSRGHTLLELAMSWLAGRAPVASIIAGASTPEQVEQNVRAVGWKLSAAELAEIDRITL